MLMQIRKLLKSNSGATAIEYGLIAALVGVVIISALTTLGGNMEAQFDAIATTVSSTAP